jgi:CDGSH-type Zn-finger protein
MSKTKPYCDHSHVEAGFTATGEPATKQSQALAVRNGPLKVTPQKNGSLMVEGALEICSASGRTISREAKTWLCRCGHSGNKPFCDGTHKKVGFTAE